MSNYYIIGTKYGENNDIDVFPDMLNEQAVSIGFFGEEDLSDFYQKDFEKLETLMQNQGETPKSIAQTKHFLTLKVGDIIALKSTGAPIQHTPRLVITAYAIVTERNGQVYRYDPENLGHLINVEFLEIFSETGSQLQFEIGGYGQTIHHITDPKRIRELFGVYEATSETTPSPQLCHPSSGRTGTDHKMTEGIRKNNSPSETVWKSAHNKIQQEFYARWKKLYGDDCVKMEENYVDLSVIMPNGEIILAEVKPSLSATYCIRQGLGQLLHYYHKYYNNKKNISLVIIGPSDPNSDDQYFIDHIKSLMNINFRYESQKQWEIAK